MNDLIRINSASHNRKRLYIKTFGCQMNVYDSEKLTELLRPEFESVDEPDDADLILINTCSVRDKPEQKLYSLLGELSIMKRAKPDLLIGVGGCVAQQEGVKIVERSSVVDFVFGTHNLSLVPSLIESRRVGGPPQVCVDYRDEWEDLPLGLSGKGRVSAFVSISRGCNKNCTYCIVPVTRGVEVSRAFDEVLREVRIATHRGAREIVLLGQTVNSYGRDFKQRRSFVELLEHVSRIEGVRRIRFTSPHPQEVREDFFELIETNPKVCRHIHMPLQSGSDRILKAMNRNYRKHRYLDIISELKKRAPDIAITTDIIVGFPGESEEDFQETLSVMKEVEFDASYSFIYSPRPGTPAATMEDKLPHAEKLQRLQTLQAYQDELTARKLAVFKDRIIEVLIDGPSTSDAQCMQGRSTQNVVVNLAEPYPDIVPGMMVEARVSSAARYTLRAKLVRSLDPAIINSSHNISIPSNAALAAS